MATRMRSYQGETGGISKASFMDLGADDRENSLGDSVAQEILAGHADKKRMRRQKETKDKLGSIQDRISLALSKYDLGDGQDFKLDRQKSEQDFDVFIIGFNESSEKKSKLLESLYNFFLLYEEDDQDSSPLPDIDFEKSYDQAVDCLHTASSSIERLASIHNALMDSYSTKLKDKENKKKTKKLEQALKEAQNELLGLKDTLETTSRNLTEANAKADGLRITLEMKSAEVEKNKIIIDKLRKQAENLLSADERQLLKQRTELLSVIEKENTELKLNLANLEFSMRKNSSQSVRDSNQKNAAEEMMSSLQEKIAEERQKHEDALNCLRASLETEHEEAMRMKCVEYEAEIAELNAKIDDLNSCIDDLNNSLENRDKTIADLEARLEEAIRPSKQSSTPTVSISPVKKEEEETVIPAPTTSNVSIDPTEALNKKYTELEEEFQRKRAEVEAEIEKNNKENQSMVDKLRNELSSAKKGWIKEKTQLESQVEKFRKMVAEMEAESLEHDHAIGEKLNEKDQTPIVEDEEEVHDSFESEHGHGRHTGFTSMDDDEIKNIISIQRPNTEIRNTLTPGPDNPVIIQVVTMYDHVCEFKDKLIDILSEIQNMGVIDETETMLMMRSMEQISTLEFSKDNNIQEQIEGIQSNIAQVMHSSEKTVHKIFKKLSKEKTKIEKLSWDTTIRPKSTAKRVSVEQCDRATSPIHHFSKPASQPKAPEPSIQGSRRPHAKYTAMFAHTDLEHNKRSLKQAMLNHKITPKQYEEVLGMMKDYTGIPQKRLQQLAKHYISHARMQIMEENIQLNRPVDEDIDDVLSRLDELYLLRRTRLGAEMDQLAAEREDLAYLLTKQLDRLEHQSGMFLIKPYIAYKAHVLSQHQKKSFISQSGGLAMKPEPLIGEEKLESLEPDSDQTWCVNTSRTTPIHDTWNPDVPKLLEMDVNRITVARNAVSQPIENRTAASHGNNNKTIKSFVVVRSTKSSGSFRARSNAPSTAEFLSFNSDRSEDAMLTSDNLPPLRSGHTSGFVSTSNSRQKLAPIPDPPSNIKVEKATVVT